nr:uncharacterized protein LOC129157154 [Nothobranchius furzeri]
MARGAAVCVQGEEQRRKYTALWRSCANCLSGGDILPQPHTLPSVRQEVSDPPAGGVGYVKHGELVLEQSREDGVERRAEVHKQDPSVGSQRVQVLQDEVEGQVDGIVYRPISSVCELQRVQEGGGEGLEMREDQALKRLHDYRRQRHRPVIIQSSDTGFLRYRDNGGQLKAGWNMAGLQGDGKDVREDLRQFLCAVSQGCGGDTVRAREFPWQWRGRDDPLSVGAEDLESLQMERAIRGLLVESRLREA